MIISGVLALIFLVLWNGNRRGQHLILAGIFALLCGGIYLLERAIVTEGERLQQIVVQLCEDFRDKRPGVVNYVSDAHPGLKTMFIGALAMVNIHPDLRLSDFQSTLTDGNNEGTVHFRANATIDYMGQNAGYQPARLILTFRREKGEWKITRVQRLNPINGREMGVMDAAAG